MLTNTIPVIYEDLSAREILGITSILKSNNICTRFTWDNKLQDHLEYTGLPCLFKSENSLYIQSHMNNQVCRCDTHHWYAHDENTEIIKIENNKTQIFRNFDDRFNLDCSIRDVKKFINIKNKYKREFVKIQREKVLDERKEEIRSIEEVFLSDDKKSAIITYLHESFAGNKVSFAISEVTNELLEYKK